MTRSNQALQNKVSISVDLSQAVYLNKKKLKRYIQNRYSNTFYIIEKGNDYCLVLKYNNMIYVAIRGTDDCKDVLADLNIIPKKTDDLSWVHRGFYNASKDLENKIIESVHRDTHYERHTQRHRETGRLEGHIH